MLFQLDVSVFPTVYYENYTIKFDTMSFFDPGDYYITFDDGVGVGSLYCQAQSNSQKSATFWKFSIPTPTTTSAIATATAITISSVSQSALSSTASQILPIGVTASQTTSNQTSSTTGVSLMTTFISIAINSTKYINATTTPILSSTTSPITTATFNITPYRILTNNYNVTYVNPCNIESFMVVMGSLWLIFILTHCFALIGVLYCITKK